MFYAEIVLELQNVCEKVSYKIYPKNVIMCLLTKFCQNTTILSRSIVRKLSYERTNRRTHGQIHFIILRFSRKACDKTNKKQKNKKK